MGGLTITPDCFGELVCCVDDLYAVGEHGREKLPTCFLVVLLERPLRIEAAGVVRCMAARLPPWTVGKLLANCPDSPRREWRDATGLFGPRLALVAEMVRRRDWDSLCGAFDQVLLERMRRRTPGEAGIDLVGPFLDDGR
jgi:hypothetical protein